MGLLSLDGSPLCLVKAGGGGGRTVSLTIDVEFKEGMDDYPVMICPNSFSSQGTRSYYAIYKDNPSLTIEVNNEYPFGVISTYPLDVPLENNNVVWDFAGMTSSYIHANNLESYTYLASIDVDSTSDTAYLKLTFY